MSDRSDRIERSHRKNVGARVNFSLAQQLEEVDREIKMREAVYPRQVHAGKLRQSLADYQMGRMKAVRDTLIRLMEQKATDGWNEQQKLVDDTGGR